MKINNKVIDEVVDILKEEVVVAEGCTEPVAIACAAAKAKEILDAIPEKLKIYVSPNILKNVDSVIVPCSGGKSGIKIAAAMGVIAGDASKGMMILSNITPAQKSKATAFLDSHPVEIILKKTDIKLYIRVEVFSKTEKVSVEVKHTHTNITKIEKNKKCIFSKPCSDVDFNSPLKDRKKLSINLIYKLTKQINLDLVKPVFEKIIELNSAIAEEGLTGKYGVNIGQIILKNIDNGYYGDDQRNRCAAYAAAGSDARMSGSKLPVVTTSGSGNQSMTVSLPIIKYCRDHHLSDDILMRALLFSHLATIHIKTNVGRLSPLCAVICAAAAVGGALVFIQEGNYQQICHAITNTLGNITGIICDGAKASCATKIATSIYTAFDSAALAMENKVLMANSGIVGKDIEETIQRIGVISQKGMQNIDDVILDFLSSKYSTEK